MSSLHDLQRTSDHFWFQGPTELSKNLLGDSEKQTNYIRDKWMGKERVTFRKKEKKTQQQQTIKF